MTTYFGTRWDAPRVDDAIRVDTPIGALCLHCGEPIAEDDRGIMTTCVRLRDDSPVATTEPVHMECDVRASLGGIDHWRGTCFCATGVVSAPFPGTYREEALLVLAELNAHRAQQGQGPL